MKQMHFLLLLLCAAFAVQAQKNTCTITCYVADKQTGEALPQAAIWQATTGVGTATDSLGMASLSLLCGQSYDLSVHYLGYKPLECTLVLLGDTSLTLAMAMSDAMLEEVVVRGEKSVTDMKTLATSTLSASSLEARQVQGIGKALEALSGVSTLRTGNQVAKPMIHGLHSNRILVLNNGVKQEGQQWGADHAPEVDAFTASQLSVVKGAATVRYGAEALGGVVLIAPAALPTEGALGGAVHALGATNGRLGAINAYLEGSRKRGDGFGWRLQGSRKRGGDMRAPDYWLTNTGVQEWGGSAAVGWKKERWGLQAYYSFYQNKIGMLKATSVLGTLEDLEQALGAPTPALTSPDFSYHIGLPRQEVTHHLAKLQGYWQGTGVRFEWQYSWQNNHRQEFDRRLGAALSTRPVIDLQLQAHALDLSLTDWKLGRWESTLGLNLAYKNNDNLPGTGRIPLIPNHNSMEAGVFVIEKAVFDRWEVELGARYDAKYYSVRGRDYRNDLFTGDQYLQNITATAGATYRINASARFQTNIGTAWRAPHVAELYSFGKKQGVGAIEYGLLLDERNQVLPWDNGQVKNEQGLKWVGAYIFQNAKFQAEATAYVNWIANYIYLKPQGVTVGIAGPYPYYRYRQTNALFKGLDLQAKWKMGERWESEGSASFIWAKDIRNNDWLPFIPANTARISLQYNLPEGPNWTGAHIKPHIQYVAKAHQAPARILTVGNFIGALLDDRDLLEEDGSNFDFMPLPEGYALLGVSAGVARKVGQLGLLRMSVQVENLLNQRYRSYTNRLRYFSDEPGRNITLSAKYIF